jgi:hypothetical protein
MVDRAATMAQKENTREKEDGKQGRKRCFHY